MSVQTVTKTCIVCPMGCELSIELDEQGRFVNVTGQRCPRGKEYAVKEVTDPRRVLTTTVAITGAAHPLLPVRTAQPIPKHLLFDAMRELRKVTVKAPVKVGDIILEDLLGTNIPVIATRDMQSI